MIDLRVNAFECNEAKLVSLACASNTSMIYRFFLSGLTKQVCKKSKLLILKTTEENTFCNRGVREGCEQKWNFLNLFWSKMMLELDSKETVKKPKKISHLKNSIHRAKVIVCVISKSCREILKKSDLIKFLSRSN